MGGVGGTHPPRLAPGGNGKGEQGFFPCCRRLLVALCAPSTSTRNRRLALLPFALFFELFCWRQLGVLNLDGCCHLSAELSLFKRRARSAGRSQSPELGDFAIR
jgi:hypothetical protein